MNLGILSVSYLNDCQNHSEWLHPFYSSLLKRMDGEDLNVIQFVVLNDDNKGEAKRNIKNIVSTYNFDSLRLVFVDPETDYVSDPDIHHARALNNGIYQIDEKYSYLHEKLDFFVVEEFDVVHNRDFQKLVSEFNNISNRFRCFFGVIGTGKYRMNYDYYGHEEDYIGIYDQPPRIAPVFLGFNTNMIDDVLELFEHFENRFLKLVSKKSDQVSKSIKEGGSKFPFFVDELCGCDLFYEMISEYNFFHLTDDRPITHIGGITMDYKRMLRGYRADDEDSKEVEIAKEKLERKFSHVKSFDLSFPEDSIFFNEKFNQDFHDLDLESYSYD